MVPSFGQSSIGVVGQGQGLDLQRFQVKMRWQKGPVLSFSHAEKSKLGGFAFTQAVRITTRIQTSKLVSLENPQTIIAKRPRKGR